MNSSTEDHGFESRPRYSQGLSGNQVTARSIVGSTVLFMGSRFLGRSVREIVPDWAAPGTIPACLAGIVPGALVAAWRPFGNSGSSHFLHGFSPEGAEEYSPEREPRVRDRVE